MNRTVVIHQPDFVPYLGFLHRFLHANLYVALDHVQFVHSSSSWTHRDKIKTPTGPRWLTVSVRKTGGRTPIDQVELSTGADWRTDNLRLIEENYRRAPFFDQVFPDIVRLYHEPTEKLDVFNLRFIEWLMDAFDVRIPYVRSSSLNPIGQKNELMADILRKVEASTYLSGTGARDYYDPEPFEAAGIGVQWQEFVHPVYPQLHGDFIPNLSSLDVLLNCGAEQAGKILRASS